MIDIKGFVQVLADTLFAGDTVVAGMVLFIGVLLVILALTRKAFVTLLIALPTTFVFSYLGILSQDMMILMIIVAVLGLAYTSRNMWRD